MVHTVTENITKVLLLERWNHCTENQENTKRDICCHLHLCHFITCVLYQLMMVVASLSLTEIRFVYSQVGKLIFVGSLATGLQSSVGIY